MRGNSWLVTKRELIIDPGLEKPLLKLHRTTDVKSFWKAVHRLLSASIANHSVGLLLQQNPSVHLIAKWTRSMPDDFFAAEALKRCATEPRRKKLLRFDDLFCNRRSLLRSSFYRRYMAPQKCAYVVTLLFWKKDRLICVIAILRTAKQGDFSPAEVKLLRQLYPQILAALGQVELLERERSVRADLEEFLRRLPLPTIILRWNLKPIYQNNAAREFCAVWEKGPDEAKRTKANSFNSSGDSESVSCSQGQMEKCVATDECDSPDRLQGRTSESFLLTALTGHNSTQADQFRWRGRATFPRRL